MVLGHRHSRVKCGSIGQQACARDNPVDVACNDGAVDAFRETKISGIDNQALHYLLRDKASEDFAVKLTRTNANRYGPKEMDHDTWISAVNSTSGMVGQRLWLDALAVYHKGVPFRRLEVFEVRSYAANKRN